MKSGEDLGLNQSSSEHFNNGISLSLTSYMYSCLIKRFNMCIASCNDPLSITNCSMYICMCMC